MVRSAITTALASVTFMPASTSARAPSAMPPSWVMGSTSPDESRNCRAMITAASGAGLGNSGTSPSASTTSASKPAATMIAKPPRPARSSAVFTAPRSNAISTAARTISPSSRERTRRHFME